MCVLVQIVSDCVPLSGTIEERAFFICNTSQNATESVKRVHNFAFFDLVKLHCLGAEARCLLMAGSTRLEHRTKRYADRARHLRCKVFVEYALVAFGPFNMSKSVNRTTFNESKLDQLGAPGTSTTERSPRSGRGLDALGSSSGTTGRSPRSGRGLDALGSSSGPTQRSPRSGRGLDALGSSSGPTQRSPRSGRGLVDLGSSSGTTGRSPRSGRGLVDLGSSSGTTGRSPRLGRGLVDLGSSSGTTERSPRSGRGLLLHL